MVQRIGGLAEPQHGDSWVASRHIVGDKIAKQAGIFKATLSGRGLEPPAEFPVLRNIVVAESREAALRDAAPALLQSYRAMGQSGLFTQIVGEASDDIDLDRIIKGRVILGSPSEVAAELQRLRDAIGYNRLITRVQWMGLEQQTVLRSLELIAREVAPHL